MKNITTKTMILNKSIMFISGAASLFSVFILIFCLIYLSNFGLPCNGIVCSLSLSFPLVLAIMIINIFSRLPGAPVFHIFLFIYKVVDPGIAERRWAFLVTLPLFFIFKIANLCINLSDSFISRFFLIFYMSVCGLLYCSSQPLIKQIQSFSLPVFIFILTLIIDEIIIRKPDDISLDGC